MGASARLCGVFGTHIDAHDLGHAMSNDNWVRTTTDPDSIRGGDLLFYGYDRLPRVRVPDGIALIAPDLIVEVRSPSDLWADLCTKGEEYLTAGVRVVVLLDPDAQTATVCRRDAMTILSAEDRMTLPDVLPGFGVAVSRLFE
jgi:Uma2 family endonuclease